MRAAVHAGILRRLAERRPGAIGVVLVYHRIGGGAVLDGAVAETVFRRQLEHIADAYGVVAARDILDAASERRAGEPFPVAITFDDDIESHARTAAPALREARLPATFFLTGRTLEGPAPFWWDDLERLGGPPPIKEEAARIESLAPAERAEVAAGLRQVAPRGGDRGLSKAEVHALARDFEIGFHTRTHDPVATVPDADLLALVQEGRDELAAAAATEIVAFAYPHGRASEQAVAAVRVAGYSRAYTGAARAARAGTEPLLIPRYSATTTEDGLQLQLARAVAAATGGGRS